MPLPLPLPLPPAPCCALRCFASASCLLLRPQSLLAAHNELGRVRWARAVIEIVRVAATLCPATLAVARQQVRKSKFLLFEISISISTSAGSTPLLMAS